MKVRSPSGSGIRMLLALATGLLLSSTIEVATGKELNVKIPAGVSAGQQIRLKGQGETAPGHPPGDLLITVSIAPHPYFKVDGNDLRLDLPITLDEAVNGGKVRVPTVDGPVMMTIKAGTDSVVCVANSIQTMPASAAGSAVMITNGSAQDWKLTTISR